jgi:Ras-related protein Rab-7A
MRNRNIKIVTIGDCYVGKTSIIRRYVENQYSHDYNYTVGLNFLKKIIVKDNIINSIFFWDTAGSERFRAINNIFYRGADACILVFDLTKHATFMNIEFWMDEFLLNTSPARASEFPFILLGNKVDLHKKCVVSEKSIEAFCKNKNIKYFSVSAKTNENLNEAIEYIMDKSIERYCAVNNFEADFDRISLNDTNKDNDNDNTKYCSC